MAKVTNKQIGKAFKNARPFLQKSNLDVQGKSAYVCYAISMGNGGFDSVDVAGHAAKSIVDSLTFFDWS